MARNAMTDDACLGAHAGPVLADIVEEAARLILPLWRSGLAVAAKADESPVTEADRAAERLILQRLARAFPDVPVISEEHASEYGTPETVGARFFLVDPIDGTKAFVRGDAHFTVNIALIENGRPVVGAVNAPALGQTWYTAAQGALRRGPQAPPAQVRVRRWRKGEALALVSHSLKPDAAKALAERYGFDRRQAVNSSIKLCLIAQGDADLYPRHGPTMEWDIAAGHAVLEAAGGSLLSPEGEPFAYGKAQEGFVNGWFVARGAPDGARD
jgi:3'(2'), 5'-bisphosphate nucleotidase